MASFGAKYPNFAPYADGQPANGEPVFGPKVTIGRMVSANLTVQLSTGELYADDGLAEKVSEFVSATIPLETDDMKDEVAAVVYGAKVEDKEVTYSAGDAAPTGGLAYYKVLMRDGKKLYKGYFYPRVQAALGNDNAQTKGSSITFGTTTTTFTVFEHMGVRKWRVTSEFDTEAEVIAWVDEKLGPAGGAG